MAKKLIPQLKPFWKRYEDIMFNYLQKIRILEKEMNDTIKPEYELEFFFVEGECVGIGVVNYSDRDKFPLIYDNQLK